MSLSATILSLEDSRARTRPLRWREPSERSVVAERLAAAVRLWQEAWGVDPADRLGRLEVRCGSPEQEAGAPAAQWQELAGAPGAWWLVAGSARGLSGAALARSELALALFGEGEVPSSLAASEVVEAAWCDLLQRLHSVVPKPQGGPPSPWPAPASPESTLAPWSGALVATLPWWEAEIRVLLSADAIERLVPPSTRPAPGRGQGLQPLWKVLSNRRVKLRIELEPFEVELGALTHLQAGYVLGTTHVLEQPLLVSVRAEEDAGASLLCSAHLGRLGESRAIELADSRSQQRVQRSAGG